MLTLKTFAKEEGDSDETSFRKYLILIIALTHCLCAIVWTAMYYYIFGWGQIAFLPFLFLIIVGIAIPVSHFLGNHKILLYTFLISITWITATIQWSIGSLDQSGFVALWSFIGPIGAVIFLSRKQALLFMLMFLSIIAISAVYEPALLGYKITVPSSVRTLFYIMNICMASSAVFATSVWFVNKIQVEKNNSDDLLLNILPIEVAKELKQKGYAVPKHFDNVTVLFTDFVGFTLISETLTPTELVEEINYCFTEFDKIMGRNGLEKIKTIGDAYLAVCGLPIEDKDHANKTVLAAIEIMEFVNKRQAEGGHFNVRIGINSGSVVAGIVGVKKYSYDIWGDCVNIAARMEQNSQNGRINISETTYELVKNDFNFTYRGKIDVKNKGELHMYFVEEHSNQ